MCLSCEGGLADVRAIDGRISFFKATAAHRLPDWCMTKMSLIVSLCVKKCVFVTFLGAKTGILGLQRVGMQAAVVFGKFFQPRSFL
jgi:hypothetical protein